MARKRVDSVDMPEDYVSAPSWSTGIKRPPPLPPTAKFVHDKFLQEIIGRAEPKAFSPKWAAGRQGTRIADHYDPKTDTIWEINTSPWEKVSEEKLKLKISQVAADYELTHSDPPVVSNAIWVGDHPLPDTGLAGELKRALEAAGIQYVLRERTAVGGPAGG